MKKLTLALVVLALLGATVAPVQAQTIFKKMIVPEGRQLPSLWGFKSVAPETTPAMNSKTPVFGLSHAPDAIRAQFVDAGEIPDGVTKVSSRTHVVRYNVLDKAGNPVAGWVSLFRVIGDGTYYINSVETGGIVTFPTSYDGYPIWDGQYYMPIFPDDGVNYYTTTPAIRLGAVDVYERVRIPSKTASVVRIGMIVTPEVFECVFEIEVLKRNSTRPSERFRLLADWSGPAVRGDADGGVIGDLTVTIPQGQKLWLFAGVTFPKTLAPGLYRAISLRTEPQTPDWVISTSYCSALKPAPLQ